MESKKRRGFAVMDREKLRELQSRGGKSAQAKGTGHRWTAEQAREAGRKGGKAAARDRAHMSTIGKLGGRARHAALRDGVNGRCAMSRTRESERQIPTELGRPNG